jgi:hypothetical protein
MRLIQPPKAALWILQQFGCSPNNEVVIGDLVERYQHRQSQVWFWKQAIVATAQGFSAEVSSNKLLTFKAILVGWGANALSQLLIFHLAFAFGIGTRSLSWTVLYGPLLAAIVCGGFSGLVVAAYGRQHYRPALFGYAIIVTIVVVGQFTTLLLFVGPSIRIEERLFFILPLALSLLHIPAVLLGGLWREKTPSS